MKECVYPMDRKAGFLKQMYWKSPTSTSDDATSESDTVLSRLPALSPRLKVCHRLKKLHPGRSRIRKMGIGFQTVDGCYRLNMNGKCFDVSQTSFSGSEI